MRAENLNVGKVAYVFFITVIARKYLLRLVFRFIHERRDRQNMQRCLAFYRLRIHKGCLMINFKGFVVVLFSVPHYVWRRKLSLFRGVEGRDGRAGREGWRTIDAVFKAKERKEREKRPHGQSAFF